MLPHAQGCGRALGRAGTWLELEFYCVPARAWHSPASEIGRTGKTSRQEEVESSEGAGRIGKREREKPEKKE